MSILKAQKQEIIKQYALSKDDTGSPEVQCAILTTRISNLTEHFKTHKKDFHSRRGLLVLIGQRKRILSYVKKKSEERYLDLIKKLGIRK
ncbi:MAG: 30S ribosomal protein S15 [Rickettsiales bacterium]|jgi:small subunit ribosomal protein S15